jgi:hypothetical protein
MSTEVTVVETPSEPVIIEGEVLSSSTEQPEGLSPSDEVSDAVAIAAIEADKEIQIAQINAEVAEAAIEAQAEAVETAEETRDELEWLRERVAALETSSQELALTIASLREQVLTPQPSPETEALEAATEIAEELAETSSPETPTEISSEIEMEAPAEKEGEKPEAVTVQVRAKRRAI